MRKRRSLRRRNIKGKNKEKVEVERKRYLIGRGEKDVKRKNKAEVEI